MKRNLLFLFLWCIPILYFAQQEDAWVYLADKQNVSASIADPITILTQKAIDRKINHGVLIDERDVPVNENYISLLKTQPGISVLAKSKWLNAVHVRGTETNINALASLVFVSLIDFADKSLNTLKTEQVKKISKFQETFTTFNYGNALNQIQMFKGDQLHLADYTGEGMTVAVLDAGFPNVNTMSSFQRLLGAGKILGHYDFVNRDENVYTNTESNHGTLVLSTMGGYVENDYVGTAPDASYYLFITEDGPNENPVEESFWVEAAERADSLGVDVINSSLGYGSFYDKTSYNYHPLDFDGQTTYITRGANIAFEKGLLIVNSAGNEGLGGINAPADSAGVLSIGAVNSIGEYVTFSSVGSSIQPILKPDVVAQGLASVVINESDGIGSANGTSFSSPIMAGGIVCLWQALPDKTNAEIMQLVRESASQFNSPDYFLGYGIPNLQLALNNALSMKDSEENNLDIKIFPNPLSNILNIAVPSNDNESKGIFYNILGKKVLEIDLDKNKSLLDLSFLSSGLYLLKIESQTFSQTFKIVKN
ncbi:S8 family serine peptidase [Gaetbulibacter aquiaggeris]|uniref:S8 family serine peptidase n=1 Tax=Gaetbulibacter aquiaggeris TaxID=1735373 RepID=A0ABW7MNQ1_9FLAO